MIFIIYTVNVYIIFYFLFFINEIMLNLCIKQLLTIYIIIIGSQDVILNEEFNPQPVV